MDNLNAFVFKGVKNTLENYKKKTHLKELDKYNLKISSIVNQIKNEKSSFDYQKEFIDYLENFKTKISFR